MGGDSRRSFCARFTAGPSQAKLLPCRNRNHDRRVLPAVRRGGLHQRDEARFALISQNAADDFSAKKLARILTDTLISRLPDCATFGRNRMLWPWRSFLRLNYPMKTNWRSCNDSINSGTGTPWMRNGTASFAAKWLSSMLNSKDKNTCDRNS